MDQVKTQITWKKLDKVLDSISRFMVATTTFGVDMQLYIDLERKVLQLRVCEDTYECSMKDIILEFILSSSPEIALRELQVAFAEVHDVRTDVCNVETGREDS